MEAQKLTVIKQYSDQQEIETQASPSVLNIKQSSLRIIIDGFPSDDEENEFSPNKKNKVSIKNVIQMIEEIHLISSKIFA